MEELLRVATQYLRDEHDFVVQHYSEIKGGLTNKLYRLHSRDGRDVILKWYYRDEHKRIEREFSALSYLHTQGFTNVPVAYYKNTKLGFALYSFVKGKMLRFKSEQIQGVTRDYLDQMVAFIVALHSIEPSSGNKQFTKAVGGCFGVGDYIYVIEANLHEVEKAIASRTLRLHTDHLAVIGEAITVLGDKLAQVRMSISYGAMRILRSSELRLSPVDFGSHNILVYREKSTFIDFEEFGWDDPMQIVAYPAPALSIVDKEYLIKQYLARSPFPNSITERLPLIVMLRELHWVSRLMLGLAPDVMQKRQFATTAFDLEKYVTGHMDRIQQHLNRLS